MERRAAEMRERAAEFKIPLTDTQLSRAAYHRDIEKSRVDCRVRKWLQRQREAEKRKVERGR